VADTDFLRALTITPWVSSGLHGFAADRFVH
jgi:hypothetical protein